MSNQPLASWNDGASKRAIQDFVARVTAAGTPDYVAPEARVAVFDNDGTLWCEKPKSQAPPVRTASAPTHS